MTIDWFDVRAVVAFAEEVAVEANKLLPLVKQQGRAHAGRKDQRRFDTLLARVRTFATNNRLNVYKKARFLNAVKWRLRDAGHEEQFIDELIALLTSALNA